MVKILVKSGGGGWLIVFTDTNWGSVQIDSTIRKEVVTKFLEKTIAMDDEESIQVLNTAMDNGVVAQSKSHTEGLG